MYSHSVSVSFRRNAERVNKENISGGDEISIFTLDREKKLTKISKIKKKWSNGGALPSESKVIWSLGMN